MLVKAKSWHWVVHNRGPGSGPIVYPFFVAESDDSKLVGGLQRTKARTRFCWPSCLNRGDKVVGCTVYTLPQFQLWLRSQLDHVSRRCGQRERAAAVIGE